jgi:hypothetical protein
MPKYNLYVYKSSDQNRNSAYGEEVATGFAIIGKPFWGHRVARGRAHDDSCARPIYLKRGVLDYQLLSAVIYFRLLNVSA